MTNMIRTIASRLAGANNSIPYTHQLQLCLAFLTVLTFFAKGQPAMAQTEDTAPPTLSAISVMPQQIDLSSSSIAVQVTKSMSDDLSGVAFSGTRCTGFTSGLVFRSPSGAQTVKIHNCAFVLTSGTELNGDFTASALFPQYAESGIWPLTSIILEDQTGNVITLNASDLAALGINENVEVTSAGDTAAPGLIDVIVTPTQVDTSVSSQAVQVTRSLTDDVSGVAYSGRGCTGFADGLVFTSPSGAQSVKIHHCAFMLTAGDALDGEFTANAYFPQFSEAGVWPLTKMIVEDQAGNFRTLNSADFAALGINASVEVVSAGDTTPPQLTSVAVFPQLIDTSDAPQSVQVTRSLTDDISGTAYNGVGCTGFVDGLVFTSPSGGQSVKIHNCAFTLTAGDAFDGEFTASANFPQFSEAGIWPLTKMIIEDQAGNSRTLHSADFAALGISSFVEIAVGDIDVQFTTAAYSGQWALIDDADGSLIFSGTGDHVIALEPGHYRIGVGEGQVGFELLFDGNTISSNEDAFMSGAQAITFKTVEVLVDPDAYLGPWAVRRGVHDGSAGGMQNTVLVASMDYDFGIAESAIAFHADATGLISETSPALIGQQNLIILANTAVQVDAGFYIGTWSLSRGIFGSTSGNANLLLVPGVSYGMNIATDGTFSFDIDGAGSVSVPNGISAVGDTNLLSLQNELINVNPGTYVGVWNVQGVLAESGIQDLVVVPGVEYLINNGFGQVFAVTTPCSVDPPVFQMGPDEFEIRCGPADTDADGVPDVNDNCPASANADQVDQDLDGQGNVCDPDLDGDGIENAFDNCPDYENAGQEDLDSDGIGDVCDSDADEDSVSNDWDNCPYIANTDQADNDLDGSGDVCDADDDNDSIGDSADNCPLDANPGQEDFNQNGQGDVCDGDTDGDGVANDEDACPLSPQSSPVNANGCTGAQQIALECVREDYVQHGQYVSCVAHAANDAVDQGLITPQEKARFVREAAQSD